MEDSIFRFKQFSVAHDKCAMKVNTDGVLLGAWTDPDGAKQILDIGTGTGVIALVLAQKTPGAKIDAIDIDEGAALQAKENFAASPWSDRLHAIHSSLQNYTTDKKYDLIISNPPYFVNDYNPGMNIAKHTLTLSHTELVSGINRLLTGTGTAMITLPAFRIPKFTLLLQNEKLFITHITEVSSIQGKPPYLALVELGRTEQNHSKTSIAIWTESGKFTSGYRARTQDFYLKL